MKKRLLKNAKNTLLTYVENNINDINEESINENKTLLEELESEGISKVALFEQNLDLFLNTNNTITKENYHFPDFLRIGNLVNYNYTPSKILQDKAYETTIPFILPIKNNGIGFFLNNKHKDRINSVIEMSVLKLIGSLPNGLVKVSLIDKTGAGQNFQRLSGLHEKFIDGKVLTEDNEIELELEGLKNSMSIITQSISANGFSSIEDYNLKTDEVPQQYQIICVSNFPTGFNKKSSENLLSLIESGPKAGIYVFLTISLNPSHGLNQNINGLTLEEFIKNIHLLDVLERPHEYVSKQWVHENVEMFRYPLINEKEFRSFTNNIYKINLEKENREYSDSVINILNKKIEDINLRPIVDLEKCIPQLFWTKEAGKGVSVPFGKRGIENVNLSLGINQYGEDESTHHGLICGATGSGKTVFIHDLILQLCMNYSPEEIQFFLLDYKEGTEFAIYKDFPYINILSMEGEVEFGLEVLDKAISIMEERAKLFKEYEVANLFNYNKKADKKLPRIILIIDEFQALLPKNQKISNKTNEKLDRILRLGRSFGINLLLATQTLKGIDLDPAILSNMPLRIALRMDEKDSVKIFGEGNSAPKFLRNPGEGIYNKSYGNSKSNVHFQAFRAINNAVPNVLELVKNKIHSSCEQSYIDFLYEDRFVYNGEMNADINNNLHLQKLIENNVETKTFYIGEPAGLSKEHLKLEFKKDFGENLILVGHDQNKAISIFYSLMYQNLTLDHSSKIIFGNYNHQFEEMFKNKILSLQNSFFNRISFSNNKNCEEELDTLYKELVFRKQNSHIQNSFESIYYYQFFIESAQIFNPQSFKDKNTEKIFSLIKDGPELGIHCIFYATDFNTISSTDLTKELPRFRKKIALQGGNSLKIFGSEVGIEFSKSPLIAIVNDGTIQSENKKFKPYNIFNLGEKND